MRSHHMRTRKADPSGELVRFHFIEFERRDETTTLVPDECTTRRQRHGSNVRRCYVRVSKLQSLDVVGEEASSICHAVGSVMMLRGRQRKYIGNVAGLYSDHQGTESAQEDLLQEHILGDTSINQYISHTKHLLANNLPLTITVCIR